MVCSQVYDTIHANIELFKMRQHKIVFSYPRKGQLLTYQQMVRKMRVLGIDATVMEKNDNGENLIRDLRNGDVLVYNMYTINSGLDSIMPELKRRGVKVFIDIEITASYQRSMIPMILKEYKPYSLIFQSETIKQLAESEMNSGHSDSISSSLLSHLENIIFDRESPQKSEELKRLGLSLDLDERLLSDNKTILLVHQFHREGEVFAEDFLKSFSALQRRDLILIVSFHPYTDPAKVLWYKARYKNFKNIRFFTGNSYIKTNDLIPYADWIVSHSSTLVDIGIKRSDQIAYQGLRVTPEWISEEIDKIPRDNQRQEEYKKLADQTFREWLRLLISQTSEKRKDINDKPSVVNNIESSHIEPVSPKTKLRSYFERLLGIGR